MVEPWRQQNAQLVTQLACLFWFPLTAAGEYAIKMVDKKTVQAADLPFSSDLSHVLSVSFVLRSM